MDFYLFKSPVTIQPTNAPFYGCHDLSDNALIRMGDPMEQRAPIVAGLGGAALVAAVLSVGGSSYQPASGKQTADTAVTDKALSTTAAFTSNQQGPWYAFCQEYATIEFDHGDDPSLEWGIQGHHVPKEADEGTVEITRNILDPTSKHVETEKFNVRKHMVGDLAGCVPSGDKLRVLIAIVPDPSETQMPPEFDRDIQAIQAAATAEHYNYTRFWFPWRMNDSTLDKSADLEAEVRRREEPGILCFRKSDSDNTAAKERLFVLLVGETPTSGVNRLQFSHALYYREQLRTANKISDADLNDVKITGPHFSASFPAMQDVLGRALYKDGQKEPTPSFIPKATLISSDASGQELIDQFKQFCNIHTPQCNLQTLSLASGEVASHALDYLERHGYDQQRIAELSEDESAFGGGELYPRAKDKSDTDPKHKYGLVLRFPRDLSSVRSLSDQQSAKVAESASKYIGLANGSPLVQLTVRDPVESDSPPAYGGQQAPAEVIHSLDDVVSLLRSHRIRAVVINASNPLDRIYLLEYLRNKLPDVRLATVDADEMELEKPHLVDLTGTIVVSTLPSLPGLVNVLGGLPESPPLSFKSSRQEGEFLSVEMLLDPPLDSNGQARSWSRLQHCNPISVVGESGFLLLADGRQKQGENPAFPCLSVNHANLPSNEATGVSSSTILLPADYMTVPDTQDNAGHFIAFLWFLGALSSVHFLCLLRSRRDIEGTLSYPHRLKEGLEARRLYLLFVINNQVLLLDMLGVRLSWAVLDLNLSNGQHRWLWAIFVPLIVSVVVLVALLCAFLKRFITEIRNKQIAAEDKQQLLVHISFASVYLIWTACMIWRLPAFERQSGAFLDRVTHLDEGLSPVMPITAILLGYSLWSWMQLKRVNWVASRRINLELQPAMNVYLDSRVKEVMAESDALSPKEPFVQLGSMFLITLAARLLWNSLNGFDGLWFHLWIVVWGFGMLLLTVVTVCFHAKAIWNKQQKLLEWLETTTMREAFQQIGSGGLLSIRIWDLANFERSFTVLNQTAEIISSLYGTSSAQASAANVELNVFMTADAQGKQVKAGDIDSLNHVLNVGVAGAVAGTVSSSPQDQNKLRLYLALRFVAFVRYTMLQIGTLIAFVAYGYVVAVLSIMFYAFEGRKTLGELSLVIVLVLLIWIGTMMVRFQRNEMLSRLEGSTPGEASYLQVVRHLLTVGGLPLLAIVTTQFPAIGNFVLLLFRPLLGTLH
jgi:hypothetical protein